MKPVFALGKIKIIRPRIAYLLFNEESTFFYVKVWRAQNEWVRFALNC